jgi:hypothetical protein
MKQLYHTDLVIFISRNYFYLCSFVKAIWLHAHEQNFASLLAQIGSKHSTDRKGKLFDDAFDVHGVHTGYGLCQIASAALEEGIKARFGSNVSLHAIQLATPLIDFRHNVLRIQTEDQCSITADGTFRQINRSAPPEIFVIPSTTEANTYHGRIVKELPPGEQARMIRQQIQDGQWKNISTADFEALVHTLTD